MSGTQLKFAALTDVGQQRDHNEDNFLVDKKLSLFIVCDGMGGHAAGEVASAIAVRTIHDELKREEDLLEDYVEGKSGAAKVNKRDITNMLEFAINRASAKVHAEAQRDPSKRGMGTTLVALVVLGQQAFIAYVGDSRAYLLRDGVLEQLTEDHTVYNELIRRKKLSRERIEEIAPKNAITRAVGVYEHAEADTLVLDLIAGDRFLLCSDGLSGYFEQDLAGLGRLLMNESEEAGTRALIDAANAAGGKDNITTVIVTVGDAAKRDEKRAKQLQLKRDTLARMPLFRSLNDRELLRVLQVTDVADFSDGQVIIQEGQKGDELYMVLSGQVRVLRGGTEVAMLKPGEHFGEMALIRNQPRSATVSSDGVSELMVLSRSEFFEILRKEHQLAVKLLWQFTGVLADRLAETTRVLGQARQELAAEDITAEVFVVEEDENRKTLVNLRPPPKPQAVTSPSGQSTS
jgi:serine/threonine protein phosphatase PrpC